MEKYAIRAGKRWRMSGTKLFNPVVAATMVCLLNSVVMAQKSTKAVDTIQTSQADTRLMPLSVTTNKLPKLNVSMTTVDMSSFGGVAGPLCPPVVVTHSASQFFENGASVNAQAGFVETEISAVSYLVNPADFPLRVDFMEWLVASPSLSVQTETHWTVIVWEGPPNTGTIVAQFSSDGIILPHIIAGPGPNIGVLVNVSIDPGDPEQIIVTDNGSSRFSVGFRIDQHNNPPVASCDCFPPFPGTLPAVCCPPDPSSNVFPASDTNGLSSPTNNWLFARACPGATGVCAASSGWITSATAGISGDWVIRTTYTPFFCNTAPGACCFNAMPDCQELSLLDCLAASGEFRGEGTSCATVACRGACCATDGDCVIVLESTCVGLGTYQGDGTVCDGGFCAEACCFQPSGCLDLTPENCALAAGVSHGLNTSCNDAGFVCFPACCLPDGSCLNNLGPAGCITAGGTSQAGQSCATFNCPQPLGGCCLSNGSCLVLIETDCGVIPNSSWAGANTDCADNNAIPGADACEPACPEDCAVPNDGIVGVTDLLLVLANWGQALSFCDVDGTPGVAVGDLLAILGAWGVCQ